jgi:hypothetical protein
VTQINFKFSREQVLSAFDRLIHALRVARIHQGHPSDARRRGEHRWLSLPALPALPADQGYRSDRPKQIAEEFMLMHSEVIHAHDGSGSTAVYGFKHALSRNYLYVSMHGRAAIFVSISTDPFHWGEFPKETP